MKNKQKKREKEESQCCSIKAAKPNGSLPEVEKRRQRGKEKQYNDRRIQLD